MRIFCLNFHQAFRPSLAEAFLSFTPLIASRPHEGLLFGEVSQTLWLFQNSRQLLEKVHERAYDLGFSEVSVALGDTAAGAQAFTQHFNFFICEPGCEGFSLGPFPTSTLRDLEGLVPWENLSQVESIAEFLTTLGLQSLEDLKNLPIESWNLRWGDLGTRLQKKISGREKVAFTPLVPDQPLVAFQHFDFPVGDRELLLANLRPHLQELLFRLEGRKLVLDELSLLLICEYSDRREKIRISPTHKTRDLGLLITLLRERLGKIDLENPVRDFEIEVRALSQDSKQLDFWEPQIHETENLLRLQSLFHDRGIESGFLKVENEILPEKSWRLQNEPTPSALPATDFSFEEMHHRELPVFSESLNSAPRPTRLLNPPQPLHSSEIRRFRFLHRYPLERLSVPWQSASRDYWMALNGQRQCVWIYKDLETADYFLQGYFD